MLLRDFNAWLAERDYRPGTRKCYMQWLQTTSRRLRARGSNLLGAAPAHLVAAVNLVKPDPSSRNNYRMALLAWYTFLGEKGIRHDNPAEALPRRRLRRGLPRPLGPEALRRYLDAARAMGTRYYLMGLLGAYAGLRVSAACCLPWTNVEEEDLHVIGKGGVERRVPMAPEVRDALRRWRSECPNPEWVFGSLRSWEDKCISRPQYHKMHYRICEAAGLPSFPYHRLRHTAATEALEASGGDLRAVQEFLGHADPKTTAIYTKVRPARLREVVSRMYRGPAEERQKTPGPAQPFLDAVTLRD